MRGVSNQVDLKKHRVGRVFGIIYGSNFAIILEFVAQLCLASCCHVLYNLVLSWYGLFDPPNT